MNGCGCLCDVCKFGLCEHECLIHEVCMGVYEIRMFWIVCMNLEYDSLL